MNALPNIITVLNKELRKIDTYTRVDYQTELGKHLQEGNYDSIIVDNAEILTDLLRETELIDRDSSLRFLKKQIDNIDILFAEVGEKTNKLRRLLLVEDKLLKNPDSKRKVLAQILEYAQMAQDKWEADELIKRLPDHAEWLKENQDDLDEILTEGKFLLIICGDRLDPDLVRFASQIDPQKLRPNNLSELCLVSIAIYTNKLKKEHLLIPNLVGKIKGSKREYTIRVKVFNHAGNPLKADINLGETQEQTDIYDRSPITLNKLLAQSTPIFKPILAHLAELVVEKGSDVITIKPRKKEIRYRGYLPIYNSRDKLISLFSICKDSIGIFPYKLDHPAAQKLEETYKRKIEDLLGVKLIPEKEYYIDPEDNKVITKLSKPSIRKQFIDIVLETAQKMQTITR